MASTEPESRIIPTPPWPGGVAIAAIRGRNTSGYNIGEGSSTKVETSPSLEPFLYQAAVYMPLLQNGENVVQYPVQQHTCWEEYKHQAERHRHILQYGCFHCIPGRGSRFGVNLHLNKRS